MYGRSTALLTFFSLLLALQVALSAWAVNSGVPIVFPKALQPGPCIMTSDKPYAALIWIMPAITDSIIFSLTLFKAFRHYAIRRRVASNHQSLMGVMLRDGTWYFCAIFSTNLFNVLIYLCAPEDLKVVAATFSGAMPSVLVNRLQLNLRASGSGAVDITIQSTTLKTMQFRTPGSVPKVNPLKTFLTVDNLGDELVSWHGSDASQHSESTDESVELSEYKSTI